MAERRQKERARNVLPFRQQDWLKIDYNYPRRSPLCGNWRIL